MGEPSMPGFYEFACMRLLYPAETDPECRVKERQTSKIGASMGRGHLDDVLKEPRVSTGSLNWSMEEAFELLGQFVQEKRAIGYKYEVGAVTLMHLDRFLADQAPEDGGSSTWAANLRMSR